jgi:hypothetical protein
MDINKYIKQVASDDNEHDKAYATALKSAHQSNKDKSKKELIEYQKVARAFYARGGSTHTNTARCTIIYELLKQNHGVT